MVWYADTISSTPFHVIIRMLIPMAGSRKDKQPTLPADAVTIPADARGAFHLPFAAEAPVLYPRIAP